MFCFNDLESQCNNKPCQGNGYCKSTGDNSFVCLCKLGFKGILCATKSKFWYYHNIVISHVLWYISFVGIHILQNTLIVAPPTPIPREKNDTTAVSIYFSNSDCVLKLIFYATIKTRFYTYYSQVSPKFVNTMLPKEITCHLNEDCPIMLPVNGNPLNKYGKQSLCVENFILNYICVDKYSSQI